MVSKSPAKKASLLKAGKLETVVGRVVARRREELGMDQAELASRLRLTQASVSRLEAGQGVTLDQLWLLSRALDLRPSVLVERVERSIEVLRKKGIRIVAKREQSGGEVLTAAVLGGLLGYYLSSD